MTSLSACVTQPRQIETVRLTPPAQLMAACPEPAPGGSTLGYLALQYTLELRRALRDCNSQLDGIRRWSGEQDKG